MVCHKGKTLCISAHAVAAHLRHGDQLGGCNTTPSLSSITENTDVSQVLEEMPKRFHVTIAPNPLNTTAQLQYELPANGSLSIKIYDVLGREVTTAVQTEQRVGVYSTELNASNLAKGVYYYRALFTTKQQIYSQSGKMMVIK
jgi:hypothetical protein